MFNLQESLKALIEKLTETKRNLPAISENAATDDLLSEAITHAEEIYAALAERLRIRRASN